MNYFFNSLITLLGVAAPFDIIQFIFILAVVCSFPYFIRSLFWR